MKVVDLNVAYSMSTGQFQCSIKISHEKREFSGVGFSRATEKEAIWNAVRKAVSTIKDIGKYDRDFYSCILDSSRKAIIKAGSD